MKYVPSISLLDLITVLRSILDAEMTPGWPRHSVRKLRRPHHCGPKHRSWASWVFIRLAQAFAPFASPPGPSGALRPTHPLRLVPGIRFPDFQIFLTPPACVHLVDVVHPFILFLFCFDFHLTSAGFFAFFPLRGVYHFQRCWKTENYPWIYADIWKDLSLLSDKKDG